VVLTTPVADMEMERDEAEEERVKGLPHEGAGEEEEDGDDAVELSIETSTGRG
jgi:hypothetical protein